MGTAPSQTRQESAVCRLHVWSSAQRHQPPMLPLLHAAVSRAKGSQVTADRGERGQLIRDFLAYKTIERGFSPASIDAYRSALHQFCAWGRGRSGSLLTTKEHHV